MTSILMNGTGNIWALPLETNFILWLQSLGSEGSLIYYLMTFFTLFGEELLIVGVLAGIYLGIDKHRGQRLGAILMTSALIFPMIKNIVRRQRPWHASADIQNFRDVSGYSFPSGHTINATAIFGGVTMLYTKGKQRRWLWSIGIAIPLLVALSRNYLGAHYLTDVLTSLILGYTIIFLLDYLLSRYDFALVLGIIAILGLSGVFFCTTEDYYTSYGLFLGFYLGVLIEKKWVKFDNTRVWWRVLLRLAVGGALYLGLNTLIKLPFDNMIYGGGQEVLPDMVTFELYFRMIRYIIVACTLIGIYPMLFAIMDKVWLQWKWIKPTDIPSH